MNVKVLFIFILFSCTTLVLRGQPYPSVGNRFEVDQKKGCAPLTVLVTIKPPSVCNGANPCDMDFEGNNQFQSLTFTHTYTQPGKYKLRIQFQASGIDEIEIDVVQNIQPEFEIYSCNNNAVSLKVTDNNYNQYVINYNDATPVVVRPSGSLATDNHTFASAGPKTITIRGRNLSAADNCSAMNKPVTAMLTLPAANLTQLSVLNSTQIALDLNGLSTVRYRLEIATNNNTTFQLIQNLYNQTTVTLNSLRPDDNYYCFRLATFDPCNSAITAYSNIICSSNFDVSAQSDVNKLIWTTATSGIANFTINKSDNTGSLPSLTRPTSPLFFDDNNIVCTIPYTYQLVSNYADGSRSISLSKSVTAFSSTIPTAVENISSMVTPTGVDLVWQQNPAFTPTEYSVFKSVNGGYSLLTKINSASVSDPAYSTTESTCYKISYQDVCGNFSPFSQEACPIQLFGSLQKDNSIILNWNAYTGWTNGVDHYAIQKFNAQGQLLQTIDVANATTFTDDVEDLLNQIYTYKIIAIANDVGVINSVSNTITIIKEPNLFYPTAFTPNNDGLNDTFTVFSQYVVAFEMKIFNRWGELLFTTSNPTQGWDGTFKGSTMPEGTYAFIAKITDLAGRTFDRSGSVVLLRKK
ncbi:MAG: gliding motility-associated C-terminal domain-containing protein [Cyclobacteriaceae bacterium]|nr:gliding motility-associated C-terminal domain-containing protein [Cyclobacteriaceae bacterium]